MITSDAHRDDIVLIDGDYHRNIDLGVWDLPCYLELIELGPVEPPSDTE